MELYAIRKNKFAGVYSNKKIYEYIKSKEANCSVRVFVDSEKNEALKWAGVNQVDLIPQLLESDVVFNNMFGTVVAKKVSDKSDSQKKNSIKFKLHSVCAKDFCCKEVDNKQDSSNKDVFLTSLVEFIDKNKNNYCGFVIKTKSNGDLFYLSKMWYYEKHWDSEYGYTIEDLIKNNFIVYNFNSSIEKLEGGYKLGNIYSLNIDVLAFKEKVIILPCSEILSVIPYSSNCIKGVVDGKIKEFKNTKEVAKAIKSVVNNLR